MPTSPVAHLVPAEAHALVVIGVEREDALEDALGLRQTPEAPKAKSVAVEAAEEWPVGHHAGLHHAGLHDRVRLMSIEMLDRERELRTLEQSAERPGGQLVVVWGRRRVGKTFLLQAFTESRRAVYYAAAQQSEPVELAGLTDACRKVLGDGRLPAGYRFPDWATALDFLTEQAGRRRLIVVLDEFPYLAAATKGLEGIVQRWWDQKGKGSRLVLVLCGSAVAYMEQIQGPAAPLHQRATLTLYVPPLSFRAAGLFTPKLPPSERAVVYGILGGSPLYLELWDQRRSLRANLLRLFGTPTSPLVDAPELVLSGEIPQAEGAFRILQAVAHGRTRLGEIGDYARVAPERPVKRLVTLGILERRAPALDDPDRTKRAVYRIRDPYFRFWFRFIQANRAQISRGLGARLVDGTILPLLDDHMGLIFEEMAREHLRTLAAEGKLPADRIESWWSMDGQHELDAVGIRGTKKVTVVGTVKWSKQPLGRRALEELDRHAEAFGETEGAARILIGRSGCDAGLARTPRMRCYSVDDMYA